MQPIDWVGRHHTRRMPSPIHNDFQVRSDRQPEFARRSIITLSCGKVSILCNQEWILDRPEDVLETHQSSPWPLPDMLPGRGRKLHRQPPRVSHAPEYIHSRETSSLRVRREDPRWTSRSDRDPSPPGRGDREPGRRSRPLRRRTAPHTSRVDRLGHRGGSPPHRRRHHRSARPTLRDPAHHDRHVTPFGEKTADRAPSKRY
jgi:hypothetical protein